MTLKFDKVDKDPLQQPGIGGLLAGLCLCLLAHLPTQASEIQSPGDLASAITRFTATQRPYGKPLHVQIGKIDPRLRLAQCNQPLSVFFPTGASHFGTTTLGVECNGDSPWKTYVSVTITGSAPMVTNTRALARGTVLQLSDLNVINRDITYLQEGFYSNPAEVVGMVVERPLMQGSVLNPKNLRPRLQVRRGDLVSILAEATGVQVYVKGFALMDGHHGEDIRVRNQSTQREIQAEVIGPGQVQVKM